MAQNPPVMLRDGGPFCRESPCLPVKAHKHMPVRAAHPCFRSGPEQPHADILTGNILRSGCREVQKMKNSRKAEDAAFRAAVFTDTAITKKRSGTDPNRLCVSGSKGGI